MKPLRAESRNVEMMVSGTAGVLKEYQTHTLWQAKKTRHKKLQSCQKRGI